MKRQKGGDHVKVLPKEIEYTWISFLNNNTQYIWNWLSKRSWYPSIIYVLDYSLNIQYAAFTRVLTSVLNPSLNPLALYCRLFDLRFMWGSHSGLRKVIGSTRKSICATQAGLLVFPPLAISQVLENDLNNVGATLNPTKTNEHISKMREYDT